MACLPWPNVNLIFLECSLREPKGVTIVKLVKIVEHEVMTEISFEVSALVNR